MNVSNTTIFEAPHIVSTVIYDVEYVGELRHLVVVLTFGYIPLDGYEMFGILESEHRFCCHIFSLRGITEPVGVVDHDADIYSIGNVGEVPHVVVLLGVVEKWQIDLQTICTQVLGFLRILNGVQSVLSLKSAYDVLPRASGVNDRTQYVRPFVVANIRPFSHSS